MSEPVEAAREALDAAEERRQLIERRKLDIRQQLAAMAKSRLGHRGRPDAAHSRKKRRLEAHLNALDEGRLPEEPAPKPPRPKLSGAALGDAVSNKAGIFAAPARAPARGFGGFRRVQRLTMRHRARGVLTEGRQGVSCGGDGTLFASTVLSSVKIRWPASPCFQKCMSRPSLGILQCSTDIGTFQMLANLIGSMTHNHRDVIGSGGTNLPRNMIQHRYAEDRMQDFGN